jgi:hypothetical protein
MAPGMLLFHDPRLYEKFGSTLLHWGNVAGVLLLAVNHWELGVLILPSCSTVGLDWASPSLALCGPLGISSFTSEWPISPFNG